MKSKVYGLSQDGNTITLKKLTTSPFDKIKALDGLPIYAFLDIETSGLNPKLDSIIELAIVFFQADSEGRILGIVNEISLLNDPGFAIPAKITEITGITDEMVRGKKIDFSQIDDLLASCSLIIAHNASFDRPFIDRVCPSSQNLLWGCSQSQVAWKDYGHSSKALFNLARDHGFFYEAHRAINDVYASIKLIHFKSPNSLYTTHLAEIIKKSAEYEVVINAVNAPFEKKDLLKAHNFRWNSLERFWSLMPTNLDEVDSLIYWLKSEVYAGNGEPEVKKTTPIDRFKLKA